MVEDTVYQSVKMKDHLMFFVPTMQRPVGTKQPMEQDDALFAGAIVLATDRPIDGMESLARSTLAGINPNLTVVKFQTFNDQIADCFGQERLLSRLTLFFGGLALLLAAIGLYGATGYSVVGRNREIGIRMAVGADRSTVISMVLRGATMQTAVGLLIGVPVALLSVRFIKSQLYEIAKVDLTAMAICIAVLSLAAFVAAIIPALRAASINPVSALRMD